MFKKLNHSRTSVQTFKDKVVRNIPGDHRWPGDLLSRIGRPWDMGPIQEHRSEARDGLPRVLFMGFSDTRGGAAIASSRLISRLEEDGLASTIELVCLQQADAPWTFSMDRAHRFELWKQLRKVIAARNFAMSDPYGWLPFETRYIQRVLEIWQPDIIHIHNIHGGRGIVPIRQFEMLAQYAPIVWTLHDMWAATGHCAYSLDCERWRSGCGSCPDLSLYPSMLFDRTSAVVREKRQVFEQAKPTLVTPSQWLGDLVSQAPSTAGCDVRVIANGVDLSVFNPRQRATGRRKLEICDDRPVLMFAAETLNGDPRKGGQELRKALLHAQSVRDNAPLDIILMGADGFDLLDGIEGLKIHKTGFVSEPEAAARFYAAADIFVCPSLQDNLPNTLIEAAACGTASVVFDAGGCPETIEEGVTGLIVPFADAEALGATIANLLDNPERRHGMGRAARMQAEQQYGAGRMATDYLKLYNELIAKWDPL